MPKQLPTVCSKPGTTGLSSMHGPALYSRSIAHGPTRSKTPCSRRPKVPIWVGRSPPPARQVKSTLGSVHLWPGGSCASAAMPMARSGCATQPHAGGRGRVCVSHGARCHRPSRPQIGFGRGAGRGVCGALGHRTAGLALCRLCPHGRSQLDRRLCLRLRCGDGPPSPGRCAQLGLCRACGQRVRSMDTLWPTVVGPMCWATRVGRWPGWPKSCATTATTCAPVTGSSPAPASRRSPLHLANTCAVILGRWGRWVCSWFSLKFPFSSPAR
jgi:hypothetical protein